MSRAFGLAWRMSRLRAGEDKMAAATDDWNRIDSSEKRANRHCFMLWTIFGGVARGGYFLSSLSLFSSIWFLLDSTLSAAAVCCVFFKVLSQESWVENIFQKSKWGGGGAPQRTFLPVRRKTWDQKTPANFSKYTFSQRIPILWKCTFSERQHRKQNAVFFVFCR